MKPDRIVIGVEDERAEEIMKRLYKPFQLNGDRIIYMDIPSAEMTKYAANAMLATKISFMNDIANLCELVGANANMVRKGIGSDPRIGTRFIYPGVGYGGSCFPKDVKAIVKTGKKYGYNLRVLQAVEDVNDDQKHVLVKKIKKHFGDDLSGKTFAIWGLSFKPNTDDMRESPSIVIIDELLAAGAKVKAYDPIAMKEAQHIYIGDKITYAKDSYDALVDADALLLVTEWSEFRIPSWSAVGKLLHNKVVFDGRNIYDREYLNELGFTLYGIGI
jgi:UDPglucose 6-dehydrogenase